MKPSPGSQLWNRDFFLALHLSINLYLLWMISHIYQNIQDLLEKFSIVSNSASIGLYVFCCLAVEMMAIFHLALYRFFCLLLPIASDACITLRIEECSGKT